MSALTTTKNNYRGWWTIYNDMPAGWQILKNVGSPLTGAIFIFNGKSVFNKEHKKGLLRLQNSKGGLK